MSAGPARSLTAAVILAGGAGRRMHGADKGLVELDGRPLVAHVMAALAGQVDRVLISANRNTAAYRAWAPVVTDGVDGFAGPLAGIAAAMARYPEYPVVSVPVDCPAPPGDLVDGLRAALARAPEAACAVVHDGERLQPLFALYRPGLAAAAARALRDNGAVWRWQQSVGLVPADFSHRRPMFRNLNTRAELDACQPRPARD